MTGIFACPKRVITTRGLTMDMVVLPPSNIHDDGDRDDDDDGGIISEAG